MNEGYQCQAMLSVTLRTRVPPVTSLLAHCIPRNPPMITPPSPGFTRTPPSQTRRTALTAAAGRPRPSSARGKRNLILRLLVFARDITLLTACDRGFITPTPAIPDGCAAGLSTICAANPHVTPLRTN